MISLRRSGGELGRELEERNNFVNLVFDLVMVWFI